MKVCCYLLIFWGGKELKKTIAIKYLSICQQNFSPDNVLTTSTQVANWTWYRSRTFRKFVSGYRPKRSGFATLNITYMITGN